MPALQLGFDLSTRGDVSVLALSGDLDLASAPAFRQEVIRLLAQGARRLVLDLSAVDFLDSAGLGLMIGALKRVRSVGGTMAVACDEDRLLEPMRITDLLGVLGVAPTVDDAIEGLEP